MIVLALWNFTCRGFGLLRALGALKEEEVNDDNFGVSVTSKCYDPTII
jgi:hypothetical protein